MKRWYFYFQFNGDKGTLYWFSALTALTVGLFAPVWLTYLILNSQFRVENTLGANAEG